MEEYTNKVSACLHCRNALCRQRCPISTDIPTVIQSVQDGSIQQAQELLFENNFMSAVCGVVCDHQRQCYGHCVLNHKNNPVPFYELEAIISGQYLDKIKPVVANDVDISVAIIGAGPSGMALAYKLACKGVQVTLFDAHEKMGGVLRYGIPDFRLDKKIVDKYENLLSKVGVKFVNNTYVNSDDIRIYQAQFDVLILAVGAWVGKQLLPDSIQQDNVYTALDVLNEKKEFAKESKVIVIGGGNVAMDVVRYCKRMCDNTYLYYRKEIKDMPANADEIEEVLAEGIEVKELAVPLSFDDTGINFAQGKTVVDEQGKKKTEVVVGSDYHVDCDVIIQAISQQVDTELFRALNIKLNQWGNVDANDKGLTSNAHVYVVGDALLGPKSVVHCMQSVNDLMKILEKRYGL